MRRLHALKTNKNPAQSGMTVSVNRLSCSWFARGYAATRKNEFVTPTSISSIPSQQEKKSSRIYIEASEQVAHSISANFTVAPEAVFYHCLRPSCRSFSRWQRCTAIVILVPTLKWTSLKLNLYIFFLKKRHSITNLLSKTVRSIDIRRFPNSLIPPELVFLPLFCVVEART